MGVAAHSDELEMISGLPLTAFTTYTASKRALSEQMIKFWGSFISNNKMPDSQWKKFDGLDSSLKRNFLSLEVNRINGTVYSINDSTCKFWSSLLD